MSMDHEARIAFNVRAIWANRFSLAELSDGRFRIAFAEAAPGEDRAFVYHSAVVMSRADARELIKGMTRLLGDLS